MQYLCLKQLTAAGTTYYPGDTVLDGVILPERGVVLVGSRYLAEVDEAALQEGAVIFPKDGIPVDGEFYTREQVEQMIADAVAEAVRKQEEQMKGLRGYAAELKEISPDVMGSAVPISVHMEGSGENGQMMSLLVEQQEIQQAFSIMQMNVEDGAKAITEVDSEHVLILLHAADSRTTIKNAAKKQADKLFSANGAKNEPGSGKETTGNNAEGADT